MKHIAVLYYEAGRAPGGADSSHNISYNIVRRHAMFGYRRGHRAARTRSSSMISSYLGILEFEKSDYLLYVLSSLLHPL